MHIWVVVEGDDHGMREGSREILTAAGNVPGGVLAAAIVFAPNTEALVKEVSEFGPQSIYLTEEWPESALGENLAEYLGELIKREQPGLVLAAETLFGRELLTKTALQFKMPFFPDCISVSLEQDRLLFERLWFGERLSAFLTSVQELPVLATWRDGLVNVKKRSGLNSNIQKLRLPSERANLIRFLEEIKADPLTVDLSDAEVIVAGGGGHGFSRGISTHL